MFDLRQRIFAGIGIAIGGVVAVLLVFIAVSGRGKNTGSEETSQQSSNAAAQNTGNRTAPTASQGTAGNPSNGGTAVQPPREPVAPAEPTESLLARQTARIFVERFGSYSTGGNNEHIADTLPLATEKMQRWMKTQFIQPGSAEMNQTTKIVASAVTAIDTDRATVRVDTQQYIETAGEKKTSYRSGRVELVKQEGVWKVDGFYWL